MLLKLCMYINCNNIYYLKKYIKDVKMPLNY